MRAFNRPFLFLSFLLLILAAPALHAADGDTTRVITWVQDEYTWPETHVATFGGFPDSTKRFRKVIMRYQLDCAAGGCDPWDVGAPIFIDRPLPGGGFETVEIARHITPYNKTGVWEADVTDYQTLLRDSVTLRHRNASYTAGPQGYAVTIEFIFIEGTPPRYPFEVERLWQGGYAYGVNTVDTTLVLGVDTLNGDTVYNYDWQYFNVIDNVISNNTTQVGAGATTYTPLGGASKPQSRTQMLWTATELTTAGMAAGNVTGIRFNVTSVGSELKNFTIRMRHTSKTSLTTADYEIDGFTEVFRLNVTPAAGWNVIPFLTAFNWNGTDNLIVDICYDNDGPGVDNVVAADLIGASMVTMNNELDYYIEIEDSYRVSVPAAAFANTDSAITISLWQYGDFDHQPQNNYIFEGVNAAGERVVNSHLPWSNGSVYWDCGNDGGTYDRIFAYAMPDAYQARWTHWAFVKDARTGEMVIYKDGSVFTSGTGLTRDMTGITSFHIGRRGDGASGEYDGMIDEFRVWNAALDSATISDWMHRAVNPSHPNYADLALYYDFNDGAGNTVTDKAPGGHDGTIVGNAVWMGHDRLDPCLRHPDAMAGNTRPAVIFDQSIYQTHLDSLLADSSIAYSIQQNVRYNSFDSTVKPMMVTIPANAAMTKLRIRTSGHGFGGNLNCAEFCPRWHYIDVDGSNAYTWQVWNDRCAFNWNYPQGGTWIYNRAGWCPGSMTDEEHLELSGTVTPGQSHSIDYNVQSYSWNGQGSRPTWELSNHLIYYEAPAHTLDASIEEVISPNDKMSMGRLNPICGKPTITIQNTGTDPLTSLDIHYRVEGGADSLFQWTGNLAFLETADVELGHVDWVAGADQFIAWVSNPNGGTDQYASNDTFRTRFTQAAVFPNDIYLYWRTNNAASETKWQLMDQDENILYQNTPFLVANTLYRDTFQLNRGCYIFRMWDTGEDGLDFFANNDGTGFARFQEIGGPPIQNFNADFGGEIRFQFTVDTDISTDRPAPGASLELFPNPNTGRFQLVMDFGYVQQVEARVYSLVGTELLRVPFGELQTGHREIDLSHLPAGMYYVEVKGEETSLTKKVRIVH